MFKRIILGLLVSYIGVVQAADVELPENFWQNQKQPITIATMKPAATDIHNTGNQGGVVGSALHGAVNNKLDNYLETLDLTWFKTKLPKRFATALKQKNINTKLYKTELNPDDKNLTLKVGADKLLVFKLESYGVKRRYNGLVPAEDPRAYCVLTGELLDKNNQVLWQHTAVASQVVEGEWDQAPNYPNLTNAIHAASESAQQELLDSFFAD